MAPRLSLASSSSSATHFKNRSCRQEEEKRESAKRVARKESPLPIFFSFFGTANDGRRRYFPRSLLFSPLGSRFLGIARWRRNKGEGKKGHFAPPPKKKSHSHPNLHRIFISFPGPPQSLSLRYKSNSLAPSNSPAREEATTELGNGAPEKKICVGERVRALAAAQNEMSEQSGKG